MAEHEKEPQAKSSDEAAEEVLADLISRRHSPQATYALNELALKLAETRRAELLDRHVTLTTDLYDVESQIVQLTKPSQE